MVERVCFAMHGLQTAGTIHVADCWYVSAFLFPNLEDLHHVGHVVFLLEPLANALPQNGGSKGPERFAPLDLGVEDCFHVGPAGIAEDGSVSQSARSPFHSALEPAHYFTVCDRARGASAERMLIGDFGELAAGVLHFRPAGLEDSPTVIL